MWLANSFSSRVTSDTVKEITITIMLSPTRGLFESTGTWGRYLLHCCVTYVMYLVINEHWFDSSMPGRYMYSISSSKPVGAWLSSRGNMRVASSQVSSSCTDLGRYFTRVMNVVTWAEEYVIWTFESTKANPLSALLEYRGILYRTLVGAEHGRNWPWIRFQFAFGSGLMPTNRFSATRLVIPESETVKFNAPAWRANKSFGCLLTH
jgi:hypothetical protein